MSQHAEQVVEATKDIFGEIKTFSLEQSGEFETWTKANLEDKELDIIWVGGYFPDELYPTGNSKPDGSLAEDWLDNGNMIITSGDWFAYQTPTGTNAAAGAENILDMTGIVENLGANAMEMKMTATGGKYLPSITGSASNRPVKLDAIREPWEVAAVFASSSGEEDDTRSDLLVLHNTETDGYMVFINQGRDDLAGPGMDRGVAVIEFIKNWASEIIKPLGVEYTGKLITLWGQIRL